jgi:glycosyltransferase involved in cell wall biosynthesis
MIPSVSILIPAYNSAAWIAETIRSAVAQTWPAKEIIVVDDGSTDGTLQVARRFQSDLVRIVSQDNRGAAATRNLAFSLSRGDYVQWLDADDLLAPDKIARQLHGADKVDSRWTLLTSSWGNFLHRPRRAQFNPTLLWRDLSPVEFLLCKLGQRAFMQTAGWLVSRELTEAAGPWHTNIRYDDDGEYFCRVLLKCDSVRFIPEAKVYYRMSGATSLSYVGHSNKKLDDMWYSMRLHIQCLRTLEDSERSRKACLSYLQNYLICFYPCRLDIVEEMCKAAIDLGGHLVSPQLPWKYAWIKQLAGWSLARRVQVVLPRIKWSMIRACDKGLALMERNRNTAGTIW